MANLMLKRGEKVRNAWVIVWLEDLEGVDKDNPYGALLAFLASLHMPCACSPVHDRDKYTEEDVKAWQRRKMDSEGRHGTLADWVTTHYSDETRRIISDDGSVCPEVGQFKKPHVHVAIFSKGPVNRESLTKLFDDFLTINPNRWQKILHPDSALRYLAHLDDEDKHEYSAMEVHGFGGINLSCLMRDNEFVKVNLLMTCMQYIEDNKVRHYHKLVRWAFGTGDYELISLVTGRASYFASFFRSMSDEKAERALSKTRKQDNK